MLHAANLIAGKCFASDNDIEYKAKDYTHESSLETFSLAARNWAFQPLSRGQWTVERSFLACLVLRVDHARGKKTFPPLPTALCWATW